jgi:hypothetical protein
LRIAASEIWWGAGLLGITFTLVTLYYSPSRWLLGWVFAWVILVAGYYVWRADHVLLTPRLSVSTDDIATHYSKVSPPNERRKYIQIVVRTATKGPIKNCRGQVLRVFKWVAGKWELTHLNETLDLWWSFVDEPTVTLEHGAPRNLNVFFVQNNAGNVVIFTRLHPRVDCVPSDRFKFDVRISGDECLPKYISVDATKGLQWDEFTDLHLELISE